MAGRVARVTDPVTITLDGERITAARGEPLACALVAAGRLGLARSPKFHRPRGPACMRAACDGCLARVDGVPNVMTCMVPAREGTEITTQNVVGSREIDLLRMTDWFFPDGMNHHELFAGVPGAQQVMQAFARRVAGLGRIPSEVAPPRTRPVRRAADVVVVGSGPSGMAVASELAKTGREVEVLDDALAPGGVTLGLPRASWAPVLDAFAASGLRVRTSTTAAALYGKDLLVDGPDGAEIVEPRALVLAPGAHDGVLAFEGNDLPGVMSARAGAFLAARGVRPGERIVVCVAPGGGSFGAHVASLLGAGTTLVEGEPVKARGTSRVKEVLVKESGGKRTRALGADALLVDAPRAPAYELCEQAGASLDHRPEGFFPRADPDDGRVGEAVWATGEVTGVPLEPGRVAEAARKVAAAISRR
jgi:sarcosine oxidase subunit alpha